MEYAPTTPVRVPDVRAAGGWFGAAVATTAFAAALTLLLYRHPPSALIVLGFAVVVIGSLWLAIVAYDTALAVAVVLLAAVRFEPAPTDVVFAVLIAVGFITSRFRLRRVIPGAVLLVGAYLALNLISAIAVADEQRAVSFFAITFYVACFGLWLAAYMTSSAIARRITRCYVAAAVASAIVATLALLIPFPGHDLFTRIGRAEGLFKDPNVFGPFLVPAALIVMEEILTPRLLRGRRTTKVLMFLALSLGVLFSYSRAAWLNLVVGLLVVLVVVSFRRGGGRSAARVLAIVVLAAVSLGAVVAFSGSMSFLEQRAKVHQSYDRGRFGAQSESITWAMEYPLGIGPGQFERRAHISAHSMYARTLAEEGIPGLIVLLTLMLATLGWALQNAIRGHDTYGIGSAALLGAWFGILLNGAFVDTLHWRHLWFVAALIWAGASRFQTRSG
jgi:O-antigen ligase/polysaccharide polymerase Wzy-like membrane protein